MRSFEPPPRAQALAAGLLALLSGCAATGTGPEPLVEPPAPYGAVPTEQQLRWQELEVYGFLHFSVNTFTDREWGLGDEDPALFAPTEFDAEQIVAALKAGGLKGVILTAKHHDGFCLWPTATTGHSVRASGWMDGRGDAVGALAAAARDAGLEFGVYVSPWDRNNALYGRPEYVTQVLRPQIEELLTRYGPVFEIWFDGANGGDGYYGGAREKREIDRSAYYGWHDTWALIRELSPDTILWSDVGPDARWIGNERGVAGDPCWATFTPRGTDGGGRFGPGDLDYKDSEEGTLDGGFWMPGECDVSIRPGWFWHASQNAEVKTPQQLMELYLASVGRGANLLLNVPPDRRGRIHEADAESLAAFGRHLKASFARNLAETASLRSRAIRGGDAAHYGPALLVDGDRWSAWIPDDEILTPAVELSWAEPQTFDLIRLSEDIRLGQRIRGVAIDAWIDGRWHQLASAQSIGAQRIWRLPETTTDRLRIRVTAAAACPALSDLGVYLEAAW